VQQGQLHRSLVRIIPACVNLRSLSLRLKLAPELCGPGNCIFDGLSTLTALTHLAWGAAEIMVIGSHYNRVPDRWLNARSLAVALPQLTTLRSLAIARWAAPYDHEYSIKAADGSHVEPVDCAQDNVL
jgi:hypothetical protein